MFSVNFKKNEKAYDSTNSEVFKMLQEAQNDPPEPGKLVVDPTDHQEQQQQQHPTPKHDQGNQLNHSRNENIINNNLEFIDHHDSQEQEQEPSSRINSHRNEETYQTYLMLATMLKYLNNGNAFAENHLED